MVWCCVCGRGGFKRGHRDCKATQLQWYPAIGRHAHRGCLHRIMVSDCAELIGYIESTAVDDCRCVFCQSENTDLYTAHQYPYDYATQTSFDWVESFGAYVHWRCLSNCLRAILECGIDMTPLWHLANPQLYMTQWPEHHLGGYIDGPPLRNKSFDYTGGVE